MTVIAKLKHHTVFINNIVSPQNDKSALDAVTTLRPVPQEFFYWSRVAILSNMPVIILQRHSPPQHEIDRLLQKITNQSVTPDQIANEYNRSGIIRSSWLEIKWYILAHLQSSSTYNS